ncbi:MAG: DUF881 domain-containing protein [Peptococcaceae bacterium]|nr:DUF881 domain-containing protein [Peptococcaceae bacterium]
MRKWVVPITLFCMFIGFFTMQAIKVQSATLAVNSDNRNEVLISLITNLEAETAAQEAKLTSLRQQTEQIISQSATGENQLATLQVELFNQQILAGLTPLVGPGIIISLDDYAAGLAAAPNEDANRFIIHYDKLLNIVNDLRSANAEAISINGQRIIASSEIRCVGNVILVNTTRLAPPFLISAIGDPAAFEAAINSSVSYETLRVAGFPVSYQLFADTAPTLVTIPAYTGSFPTANLKIVEMEG